MGETEKPSVKAREETEQISAETGRSLIFILSKSEFLSKRVIWSTLCVNRRLSAALVGKDGSKDIN